MQIPRRFWKIVAWAADDGAGPELRAAAYLLDQTHLLQDLRGESAFGAFGAAQVSVALVGAMTKVEFGPLEGADVLLRRMMRGGLEAATPSVRPLRSVEDSLL